LTRLVARNRKRQEPEHFTSWSTGTRSRRAVTSRRGRSRSSSPRRSEPRADRSAEAAGRW